MLESYSKLTYFVSRDYKNKDSFVGVFSMRSPQIIAIDPKLVQEIWTSKFHNFEANQFSTIDKDVDPIFGRNPFGLVGQEWKEKRAEISPGFTSARVKASYPIMLDVCDKLSKFVERKLNTKDDSSMEARDLALRFTCEVVADCILGLKASGFESDDISEIQRMGGKLFEQNPAFMIFVIINSICPFVTKFYQMKLMAKHVEDFFLNLTREAIKIRSESKVDRVDFLNYLLELKHKGKVTDFDITAHTVSFLLDGMETSSLAIAHMLLLVSCFLFV